MPTRAWTRTRTIRRLLRLCSRWSFLRTGANWHYQWWGWTGGQSSDWCRCSWWWECCWRECNWWGRSRLGCCRWECSRWNWSWTNRSHSRRRLGWGWCRWRRWECRWWICSYRNSLRGKRCGLRLHIMEKQSLVQQLGLDEGVNWRRRYCRL